MINIRDRIEEILIDECDMEMDARKRIAGRMARIFADEYLYHILTLSETGEGVAMIRTDDMDLEDVIPKISERLNKSVLDTMQEWTTRPDQLIVIHGRVCTEYARLAQCRLQGMEE